MFAKILRAASALTHTRPASESALREWPINRRINKTGAGDDDPMTIEPIESGLL
jgi:hypothetical protein